VVENDKDILDHRLEETLDLFQPTAQQSTAAEEVQDKFKHQRTPKSRRWDRKNPSFAFRILPEDNERIAEWADRLSWTRDEVARGLVGAALEALDQGRLSLEIEREVAVKEIPVRTPSGRMTRRRIHTSEATIDWIWRHEDESRGHA